MNTKLQTVHVRVNDAATGQPTPVRVRFTDAEGNYHAPLGRLTDFATGRNQDVGGNVRLGTRSWAYTEGSFEINLPPGTIHVEIHKGPEYRPLSETIHLNPGKLALRFTIERLFNLPAQGWYSGDGRVHFLSPHGALLEAQAEDVHVVNLLATSVNMANIVAFSGQKPALEAPGYFVVVNTHNTHPELGSLGLLNCHRVVYPLTFGGPEGAADWTMAAWCDQCHRKNGLVVWTRTTHETADGFLGEPLIDLLLGKVDAFEIEDFSTLPLWYDLLEAGIKVPLIGSSGKESNASALGVMRTYARLQPGEELQYKTWIEAVRAGRTFVTKGPLLLLTVNDENPGAVINLEKPGETVHVQMEVRSQVPIQNLEILVNGKVAMSSETESLEVDLPITEAGWLAARCRDASFAHTSPVYLRIKGQPPRVNPEALKKMLLQIDQLVAWSGATERYQSLATEARKRFAV